ncbi:MAG: glycosyltransferase family 4 protein [Thermoprotei archaeon]
MKVALLVDELPTSSAPKIVGEEAYHLERLGVKCDVYVLKYKVSEIPPVHAESINLKHLDENLGLLRKICEWRVPSFSFFSLYHIAYPCILSGKASKVLAKYDVVISHFGSTLLTSRLSLKRTMKAFYCWDPLSYIFEKAYMESWSKVKRKVLSSIGSHLDKWLLSKFDMIILPSKFHLQRIMNFNINKPIRVVYPGTDVTRSIPKERGDYLLAVARWERGKNPFFFIKIAIKLKRDFSKNFKIIMVGPWSSHITLEEFRKSAKKADVFDVFKIVGPKYGSELKELYIKARCLIHAKTEAFGFTGLEAAAHGCPIIFPKGSGVTELFIHGEHGYFPKEGVTEEYAEYISRLLDDERLAWKMGYEAWNVAKNYTWENHARQLEDVIKRY